MKALKSFFLGLAFVAGISSVSSALTLAETRTEIRRNVRDTSSVSTLQRYSDTQLNAFINEAQKLTVNLTWCIMESTSYVQVPNTTYYALPNNFIAMSQVTVTDSNGRKRWLEEVSKMALTQSNPDFERQTGQSVQYFTQYSQTSGNALEIAYVPVAAASSTGTVRADYYASADTLSSDGDEPFNGLPHLRPYHYALVQKVTARIKMIEGLLNDAQLYEQSFVSEIQVMINKFNQQPNYRPSLSAVGGSGR